MMHAKNVSFRSGICLWNAKQRKSFVSLNNQQSIILMFWLQKDKEKLTGKGWHHVEPVSWQKVDAWCPLSTLMICANTAIWRNVFYYKYNTCIAQKTSGCDTSLASMFSKTKCFFYFVFKEEMPLGKCLVPETGRALSHRAGLYKAIIYFSWFVIILYFVVFARAFADVIHKDCKNKNVVNWAIIWFIQNPHLLRYFSLLSNAVYWCLYSVIIKIR